MRNLSGIVVFLAAACGGSNLTSVEQREPAPRPAAAEGGFQAQQPSMEGWRNLGVPREITPIERRIELGGQGGQIATLMIKGVSGEPEVAQVQIEYMDKSIKRVDINRRFVPGDGQVIELKTDRPISTISVFMDPDSQGQVEIFGA